MNHSMKLIKEQYEMISSGKKTIEIRVLDEKRRKLNVGDIIEFSKLPDLKDKIKVKITALLKYGSFNELINSVNMKNLGYSDNYSKENFLKLCYSIYSKDLEQKYGVVGIKISLIKT